MYSKLNPKQALLYRVQYCTSILVTVPRIIDSDSHFNDVDPQKMLYVVIQMAQLLDRGAIMQRLFEMPAPLQERPSNDM